MVIRRFNLQSNLILFPEKIWLALTLLGLALSSHAGPREDAKWLHDRIAGVPPSEEVLEEMATEIDTGDGPAAAARIAMDNEAFYSATLKRMAAPWTNRDQDPFVALNDYIATFIGVVRDDRDLREILYADMIYTFDAPGIPGYSNTNNNHYEEAEEQGLLMADDSGPLQWQPQSQVTGMPPEAVAGVMTTRASAESFFYLGTNRAMLRFTLMAHLCRDLEQMEDTSGVPDRIRQDVSRSPGGDSRLFTNGCVGCHAGMDPLAQAFAYHDWDVDNERMTYNTSPVFNEELGRETRVTPKHHINAANFPYGYVIEDDSWDNYWREGPNANLGWDEGLPGSGSGISSMGRELAHSRAFAQCQVQKVFKTVCLRKPEAGDESRIGSLTTQFNSDGNLKNVFAQTAAHCLEN